jgi:DNA-binding CsgD family transcriptional regulator
MTFTKRLLTVAVAILFALNVHADGWNSFILNYPKSVFGKGSQTWQVATYNDRWTFFANRNGLLQFNGLSWNCFPLHNGIDLRSVSPSADGKRIYVGGINEFGFFTPSPNGKLVYTCLSEMIRPSVSQIGNVWNILENGEGVFFQGDGSILKYLGGHFTLINVHEKIDCTGLVNGILYIGTAQGVFILVGNTVFPLHEADILLHKRIRAILPYGKATLFVTAYDGLYIYDGRTTQRLTTGIESFLQRNEVFCAAISRDNLALGTIQHGLTIINLHTRQAKYFSEINGMQNNTILSASFDKRGNLWAGLDSGIDYILLNSSLTNLYSFPYSYGTGYTSLLANNILYLGTNRGLYYTSYPVHIGSELPNIKAVPNGSGQVWNLQRVGNDIICLHDRGVFVLQGTSMHRVGNVVGAWTCQAVEGQPNKMFIGMYDGIYLFKKVAGQWQLESKIAGIAESSRYFAQSSAREIWLYYNRKNTVDRFILNGRLDKVVSRKTYPVFLPVQSEKNMKVVKVGNNVCFVTSKGIYEYNRSQDKIVPANNIERMLNVKGYVFLSANKSMLVGLTPTQISILDTSRGIRKNFDFEGPSMSLVEGAEAAVPLSDTQIIIPNDNGFALFDGKQDKGYIDTRGKLQIKSVYLTYPKDSLIYTDNFLSVIPKPRISFGHNSIRMEYGIPSFVNVEGVMYQYRLNNKEWSGYTANRVKELSNLSEGNYTFEVRALFPNGSSSTASFAFTILPPWYRSGIAYIFYLLLFILGLWYLYRWDDMRVNRKKQQAVKEKDRKIKQMEIEFEEDKKEKEQQIMQLEKDNLEHELQHKSQEMANLMINFVRKNEILTEIRTDLSKVMSTLRGDNTKESKQLLLLVRNKIESNIQGDEVLKRIEDQFDLVHNNFMKTLREKHPDLSSNERMMCAYLKMNLSTKEIAPLLNISVRGVETIRYRLRKKFNLEREESLTDYINRI